MGGRHWHTQPLSHTGKAPRAASNGNIIAPRRTMAQTGAVGGKFNKSCRLLMYIVDCAFSQSLSHCGISIWIHSIERLTRVCVFVAKLQSSPKSMNPVTSEPF